MPEEPIGVVVKFFAKPSVAALQIKDGHIRVGDTLHYAGHTTDFTETIASMQVNNQPVTEAGPGDLVGIQVKERVRENDQVSKVVDSA